MDFRKIIKILKLRRWTFLTVAVVSFLMVALAPTKSVEVVPVYKSSSKVLLTSTSTSVRGYNGAGGISGDDITRSWFADEVILNELILSEELLTRVATKSEKQIPWVELRSQIAIEPLSKDHRGLKLFVLSVTNLDPKEAQKLTRLLSDEFVSYVQELSAREFANTRRFIEELVLEAEQRRLAAEEALMEVREKYLGLPTDEEIGQRQRDLESQRLEAQREIGSLQAEVAAIQTYTSGSTNSAPWAVLQQSMGAIGSLEENVSNLTLELAKAKETYNDDSTVVKAAEARLQTAQKLYQEGLNDYVTSLYTDKSTRLSQMLSRSQSLSAQLTDLLRSRMTPDDRRVVTKLERERTLWEENHLSLLQQLYQARVVEQSSRRQGSVNILEQPRLGVAVSGAAGASSKSQNNKLALAIPFCLIMGLGAALLRDYLATSLRLRPRVEEALEIPVIAVIPSTPSELTVDWERFKRPMPESIESLIAGKSEKFARIGQGKENGR